LGVGRAYIVITLIVALLAAGLAPIITGLPAGGAKSVAPLKVATITGRGGTGYLAIYYGQLNGSGLDQHPPDMLIFSGTRENMESPVLSALRSEGTILIAYPHTPNGTPLAAGSSFNDLVVRGGHSLDDWVVMVEKNLDKYKGRVDGIILDEVDPSYFGRTSPRDPLVELFSQGVREIVDYAHSIGLKVVINGARAYAGLGDYYLWEGWCSTFKGSEDDPVYEYVTGFFQHHNADSNPYDWTNDIAKLTYLSRKGLLDRTLAVSLGPAGDWAREEACYASAAIVGFKAWGYADATYYSNGGPMPPLYAYSLGPAYGDPIIDAANRTLARLFTAGSVRVTIGDTAWRAELSDTTIPLPPLEDPTIPLPRDSAPYTDIIGLKVHSDGVYATLRVLLESNFKGSALQVFIDSDNNPETGYTDTSVGIQGADLLVEAVPGSGAVIYEYNGSGGWSWTALKRAPASFQGDTIIVSIPEAFFHGTYRLATLDSKWEIADLEPNPVLPPLTATTPGRQYSIPLYMLHKALTLRRPGICVASIRPGLLTLNIYTQDSRPVIGSVLVPGTVTAVEQKTVQGVYRLERVGSLRALNSTTSRGAYFVEGRDGYSIVTIQAWPGRDGSAALTVYFNASNGISPPATPGMEAGSRHGMLLAALIIIFMAGVVLLLVRGPGSR